MQCPETDLYALGALLYRLRAGRDAFGGGALEIQLAHLGQPPAPLPTSSEPGSAALARLIDQLLAKRRSDRPANADLVIARLQSLLPRRRVLHWAMTAAMAAAISIVTGAPTTSVAIAIAPTIAVTAPKPAVNNDSQPWALIAAGDYTLRASWTRDTRVGDRIAIAIAVYSDLDGELPTTSLAATERDPSGNVTAVAGAAMRSLELPARRIGDYVLTVFAPDGDITLVVSIPVAAMPMS